MKVSYSKDKIIIEAEEELLVQEASNGDLIISKK